MALAYLTQFFLLYIYYYKGFNIYDIFLDNLKFFTLICNLILISVPELFNEPKLVETR